MLDKIFGSVTLGLGNANINVSASWVKPKDKVVEVDSEDMLMEPSDHTVYTGKPKDIKKRQVISMVSK